MITKDPETYDVPAEDFLRYSITYTFQNYRFSEITAYLYINTAFVKD